MSNPSAAVIPEDGQGWAFDPDRLFHQVIDAGERWADAEAAASLLEETRKPLLAKLGLESGEKTESGKDRAGLASFAYREHVERMVSARRDANREKVRYISYQLLAEMKRTAESTRRAEINLR